MAALTAVCATTNAQLGSVGLKFLNGNGGLQAITSAGALQPADLAGATLANGGYQAAQTNWNNLGRWGNPSNPIDQYGTASGLYISWDCNNIWSESGGGTPAVQTVPDLKLMNAYDDSNGAANTVADDTAATGVSIFGSVNNKPWMYVSNIVNWLKLEGACSYDVVIYSSGDTAGRGGRYWIQAASGVNTSMTLGRDLTGEVYMNNPSTFLSNPSYVEVPLTANTQAGAFRGNFIVFPGLTADSILIRPEEWNTRSPINAIQLIPHTQVAPAFNYPPPASPQIVFGGSTATLFVPASGCGINYQWMAGAIGSGVYTNLTDVGNISGSASARLIITNLFPANAGDYVLVATNGSGTIQTTPITLQVPAQIITGPFTNEVLYPNMTAHFVTTVSLTGTNNLFTWYKNTTALTDGPSGTGSTLTGSATSSLTVSGVGTADVANYWMVVSNVYGMTTSAVSSLSLIPAPAPGSFAEAVVTNSPLAYWRFDETDPTLMALDNAGGLNGTYGAGTVLAQNGAGYPGFVRDNPNLAWQAPNAANGWVTIPPLNLNTNTVTIVAWVNLSALQNNWAGILTSRHNGTAAGFNFSGLSGKQNMLSYTWDENTANTYNADTEIFVTNNVWTMVALVVTPTNATFFACDPAGGIRSANYGYANNQELFYGPGSIGNDDTYASGRTMNGYIDDVAVFNHALSPTAITWLYVAGSAAGVVPPPTIAKQPLNQELYQGRPAVFSVVPAGLPPFSYQWRANGIPLTDGGRISGSTNATLVIANTQPGDATTYDVVVANNGGPVTSTAATLALTTPTGAAYEAAVIASAPYAYWRLNEAVNSLYAWDFYGGYSAAYGSYASATAGSAAGPISPDWPGFETGNVGLPLYWQTQGDTVAAPPLNLNTNTVTITAWINPAQDQTTNYVGLVFSRQNLTTAGLSYGAISNHLGLNWNGAISSADANWDPGIVVPDNQWSFAAAVVEPNRSTLYLYNANGQVAKAQTVAHANQAFDGLTYIGEDSLYADGTRGFNGTIDEVTIWNRALTGPQIAALYTAASGVQVPPSVVLQPVPITIYVGKTNQLSVTGAGTGPLTYQWYSNGVAVANGGDILGANTNILSFTNAALSDAGNYACVVTSPLGSATSTVVALSVLPVSASPVFSATASATYVNLTNQTGIVVGCEDFGATEYTFNVTNGSTVTTYDFKVNGSVASVNGNGQSTGSLNGTGSFGFTSGNANFDNVLNEYSYDGGPKTITIYGLLPGRQYTVQLYSLDDRDSSGGQHREQTRRGYFQDPYNLTNVSSTFYMSNNIYVKATFTASATTQTLVLQLPGWPNNAATDAGDGNLEALVVRDTGTTPAINYQPASTTRYLGVPVSFSAGFYGPAPLGYQWQANTGSGFTNLPYAGYVTQPNATTVGFTNPAVAAADAGSYRLIVTNSAGATTSLVATLTVISPNPGSYEAAVLSYGPYAYWQFDEAAGVTVAHDNVGGFDGTYQPTCTNGVPGVPSSFAGFQPGDLAFESVYGYTNSGVIVPALNFPATNTITWTAWIAPSSTDNGTEGFVEPIWTGIVTTRASTYASGMNYNNLGMLAYTWNQNNGNTYNFVSGITIPSDQWSFVAVAISSTNAMLCLINASGVQVTNNPIAHDAETWNGVATIGYDAIGGATPFARNFNGTIDDVAIFTSTLSQTEIQNLYSAVPLAPPVAPTGLTATVTNSSQVALSWGASASANTYVVNRATVSGGPYTPIATGLTGLAYTDTTAIPGVMNYYVVSAVNTGGQSPNSGEASAMPIASTRPRIGFGMVSGQMQITWAADHLGWLLQSQTNALNIGLSTNWVTMPGSSATNSVMVPNDGNPDGVFFRLVHP